MKAQRPKKNDWKCSVLSWCGFKCITTWARGGGDRVLNAASSFFNWLDCNFQGTLSMTRPRFFLNFKKIGAIFLVSPSVGSWADVRPMKTIGKERLFVWRMRTETLIFWYNHLPISVNKTLHNMVLINVIIRIYISFFPVLEKKSKLTRLKTPCIWKVI